MAKKYGLAYCGSKSKLAEQICAAIEPGRTFYDVFCGGCAVTDCMMRQGRFERYVANDLCHMMPKAFYTALTGGFKNCDAWVGRGDFALLKHYDVYAAICFSFGSSLRNYCYAFELEPYKHALHRHRLRKNPGIFHCKGKSKRNF